MIPFVAFNAVTSDRGERMYACVEEYAALGDHRTASPVDDATRAWFGAELEARGATVDSVVYEFDDYVATASVTVGGRAIDAMALSYSGVGGVDTTEPLVTAVDAGAGFASEVEHALDAARGRCEALVIVTEGPGGRLVALNRAPVEPAGPLAVLVGGRDRAALDNGPVRVVGEAQCARAVSATVTGAFGDATDAPLVVATPLSGWFGCAGERGTGIAITLEVAVAVAAQSPVLVVATTGHEIGFLGLHDYLARGAPPAYAVLHVGAGAAAGDGHRLGTPRLVFVDGVDDDIAASLERTLAPAELHRVRFDGEWPTEGQLWRALGAPVVSIVGGFDLFHTADDVPHAVTSPALLDQVASSVLDAAGTLVAGSPHDVG
jgi:hypothetical protein